MVLLRRRVRARAGARGRSDGGFTLPELIVSITIMGVMVTVVSSALILGLRTSDEASRRLGDSFDGQLVTRYLVPDAQSAASWDDRSVGSVPLNTGCFDSSGDVLRLVFPSLSGAGAAVRYELRTAGLTKELVRHRCDFPSSLRSVVVAHDLSTAVARTVSGVLELVITTASGQSWVISSQPRPGRQLAIPATIPPTVPPSAAPTLSSLEARDDDGDGFIERILATFSADIACSGPCSVARWPIAGTAPSGATVTSVSVSGAVATLGLTGHSATRDTAVPAGFTVALTTGDGGIEAAAPAVGQSSFAATAPLDRAGPVLTALEMRDSNTNGKVDRVEAAFSEPLAASTDAAPWSLTGTPSGGGKGSVSTTGSKATVVVTEGGGSPDTAVGNFRVSLASNPTGIRDAAGNLAAFSDATPADKAGPVPVSITSTNAAISAGLAEQGDTVTVEFSEPLAALSSVASQVTLATSNGDAKPVTLSISGLSAAPFAIGRTPNYLAKNSSDVVFTGSTLSQPGPSSVRLTLGATAGGTRTQGVHVGGDVTAFAPASSLRDAADNTAAGSIVPGGRFF